MLSRRGGGMLSEATATVHIRVGVSWPSQHLEFVRASNVAVGRLGCSRTIRFKRRRNKAKRNSSRAQLGAFRNKSARTHTFVPWLRFFKIDLTPPFIEIF